MPSHPQRIEQEQAALLEAIDALLTPLASLCLAKGLPVQRLEEALRRAMVNAASANIDPSLGERKTSRISAMTGLTRREVDRIRQSAPPARPISRSLAGDVLTHWISDARYQDSDGNPSSLPRSGELPSFETLAAQVSRDVHHRTILDEMCRLGMARHHASTDRVELLETVFVPSGDWPRMVAYLGANVGDHLRGATANVLGQGNAHFEQSLLADELSSAALEQAKSLI
jgi:hypothetical protein